MYNPLKLPTQDIANDVDQLANDADTLIAATAEMAGEQIKQARKRLASMLGRGLEIRDRVRVKALEGTKAADVAMHRHLYQILGIGVGAGAVLGFLLASRDRCVCKRE